LTLTLGSLLVPYIPRSLAYLLARLAGSMAYLVALQARQNIKSNLAVVMGLPAQSSAVRRAARHAFTVNACNWVDTLRLAAVQPEELEQRVQLHGWQVFEQAVTRGGGVILLGVHLGNIDLAGQIVAARGFPFAVPVERMQPERLFRRIQRLRSAFGIRVVPTSSSPRPLLRSLRAGETVGLLCDRNVAGSGVSVSFFGRPFRASRGPAWLARNSAAEVIMACGLRRGQDFEAYLFGPLSLRRTEDVDTDIVENTRLIMQTAEALIRRAPDQWLMFVPAWPAPERPEDSRGNEPGVA